MLRADVVVEVLRGRQHDDAASLADLCDREADVAVVGNRGLEAGPNGFVVQLVHLHRMRGRAQR